MLQKANNGVDEIVFLDNVAIRDTASANSNYIDLSNYSRLNFLVTNGTDQPMKINLQLIMETAKGPKNMYVYTGETFTDQIFVIVPSDPAERPYNLNSVDNVFNMPLRKVRMTAVSSSGIAPTSGVVRIVAWGVKR